ncbi:MAG TPA: zf-HC2 domain-containing protein [Gemmataceae bacterium]|nr:zf-HC2 domain-containing protein [Gemmataceae bacterium]
MMTCRELVDLLIDFVADELPPERRAVVEEHLKRCPPCLAYLETYQLTIRITRKLPAVDPPPQLLDRLRAALQAGKGQPPAGGCWAQ